MVTTRGSTWGQWLDTGTGGSITYGQSEWKMWVDMGTTTTATTSITGTWDVWVSNTTSEYRSIPVDALRANEAARAKRKLLREERRARARKLLMQVLNAKQKQDLEKHNYFYVIGGKTGNRYRIDQGRSGNVKLLSQDDKVQQSWCAHPRIGCPDEDTMLAQKIMLEHMEGRFKDIANITVH